MERKKTTKHWKIKTNGLREAEDSVEKYFEKNPNRKVDVYVNGEFVYTVSVDTDSKPKFKSRIYK